MRAATAVATDVRTKMLQRLSIDMSKMRPGSVKHTFATLRCKERIDRYTPKPYVTCMRNVSKRLRLFRSNLVCVMLMA